MEQHAQPEGARTPTGQAKQNTAHRDENRCVKVVVDVKASPHERRQNDRSDGAQASASDAAMNPKRITDQRTTCRARGHASPRYSATLIPFRRRAKRTVAPTTMGAVMMIIRATSQPWVVRSLALTR